ncbi:MAG TPA: biosynthetic-type acetolactate synthase large subunit [Tissierellaceae bacterium]|nr:biosynthetic-type acetolactate synthase large subunit [Tissierellaceae bacterium]
MNTNTINGANILLESLARLGVDTIFGYPGGSVIPIYDAIYDFKKIHHYFARHEQGAAHEADGYARATGKVGVCLATSGPGATNLVTGIMTSHMDSIPLLAITGQVTSSLLGKDAFQESDIVGITIPITKMNYLVKDIKDLPITIKEAYYIASTGRPGPVLIDIPKDIQVETITVDEFEEFFAREMDIEGYVPNYKGHPGQIKKAVGMINEAKRPLIISGAGVIKSQACDELRVLAESMDIPVTSTMLGLGGFPSDHELSLDMLGMHGTVAANFATEHADLIIAAGMRFDDRIAGNPEKFCKAANIIHIDIDPAEIEKNKCIEIPIVGDLKIVLSEFNKKVNPKKNPEWVAQISEWKREYPMVYIKSSEMLMPQEVLEYVDNIVKGEAIVATDVGQHQMWAAQFIRFNHPKTMLTSGGSGTMGFGLPAAIGAQVGNRDKRVLAVVGDGGFQMTYQELMMLKQYNLPIKIILLNNSYLGMVRQWQEMFFDRRYSSVELDINPDFEKIGEAYGIDTVTINTREELEGLDELIKNDKPVIINCIVEREANVFPMIPSGESVENMMGMRGVL